MLRVLLRTVLMYVIVCISVRLMGKRQIGDMQPSELVITLLISEIAAIPLQDTTQPLLVGVVSMFMLVFLEISASIIILKSNFMRRIVGGKAIVIIKNGQIDQKAMKSVRMTVNDLTEMLRSQGFFDLTEIDSAILEVNGTLSVRPKPMCAPATGQMVCKNIENGGLPVVVISDGTVIKAALKFLNISYDEVQKILNKNQTKAENVFIMTLDFNKTPVIINKEQNI